MVIPFLGIYMTQSLHFGLKETGTVLSFFGIGAVCGSWFGGWLTDRAGHFNIQFICLLLSAPVFALLPELKTPDLLSSGVFFLSLITETFRPANSVAIASYTNPGNVTKAFSLNRMAINLGFSIGPALGGFLAGFSFSWLFYGNAATAALSGLVFYLYFSKHKGSGSQLPHKTTLHTNELSPWRDRYFLLFVLLCCVYNTCFFQLMSTVPLFYRSVHHLNEWNIGLILAFSGLVVFALEMFLVHIAERFSSASVIILGTLLCGASFLLLIIPGKYPVLYVSIFVLCISEILAMPFMSAVGMRRASKSKRGAYMGMNALAFSAAHIFSPFLGTRIADHYGFTILWISTGVGTIITSLGFWWVMRRL